MKILSLATLLTVTAFIAAPVFALESKTTDEHEINGRSEFEIVSTLRDRGVTVSGVEQWGSYIRAWVPNAEGGTDMQFFDSTTLQPATLSRG